MRLNTNKALRNQELKEKGEVLKEENIEGENEEEDDNTVGALFALAGVAAIGVGIFYVLRNK